MSSKEWRDGILNALDAIVARGTALAAPATGKEATA